MKVIYLHERKGEDSCVYPNIPTVRAVPSVRNVYMARSGCSGCSSSIVALAGSTDTDITVTID